MYILAIETTGPVCSVALFKNNEILSVKNGTEQRNHLKDLMPLVRELLDEEGVSKKELDYIAASVGPGSFTGVRIGVTTARALGQALGIKVVAVPSLDAFCYKLEASIAAENNCVTCAIINARRGQVYGIVDGYMEAGPYMLTDVLDVLKSDVFECSEDSAGEVSAVSEQNDRARGNKTGKRVMFFADGIDAYSSKIEEILGEAGLELGRDYFYAEETCRHQDAVSVALLAAQKVEAGDVLEVAQLLPEYMRKAEAQQKLEAGQLPICKGPKQE